MSEEGANGWRPGERMYRAPPEKILFTQGAWRPSKILQMNDPDQKRKGASHTAP